MNFCAGTILVLVAIVIALAAQFPVRWFARIMRRASNVPWERSPADIGVPPAITGTFERLLAFGLFFLNVSDAYTILALWIAAKLASNWQRRPVDKISKSDEREVRVQTLIALMAGTLSVGIGAVAGAFARTHPWLWTWMVSNC